LNAFAYYFKPEAESGSRCLDTDKTTVFRAFYLKFDDTVNLGKQCVVLATADIGAGVEMGATLTHDNIAGTNHFTTEALDAKAFGNRVSAVTGAAACFFCEP